MKLTYKQRENLTGFAFVSIWIIGFLTFTLQPLVYSLYLSFQDVKITALGIETEAVGGQNYKNAFFSDAYFTTYLVDFLKELVLMVPVIIVFSLIIALLLNLKIKFKGAFRTIFFLPVIIMTGPVIEELINQQAFILPGMDNYTIVQYIRYYFSSGISDLLVSLISNMAMVLWYTGVQAVIFLAALQKIDEPIYEAARIDGASPWEAFWKITLPTLKPMILVNIIYTIVTLSTFALNKVSIHISDQLFGKTGFGYASSLSWIYFMILAMILIVVALVMTISPKAVKHTIGGGIK